MLLRGDLSVIEFKIARLTFAESCNAHETFFSEQDQEKRFDERTGFMLHSSTSDQQRMVKSEGITVFGA